jgi:hypothetical protein
MKPVKAWAWAIDWHGDNRWTLCQWAEFSKEQLRRKGKPSPEAKYVRVELRPVSKKNLKK